jgi:hypothetical protein
MLSGSPAAKADEIAYRADIRRRMADSGRSPDECVVLPFAAVVIEESLVDPDLVLPSWSVVADLSKIDPPEVLDVEGGNKGSRAIATE